MSAYLLPSPIVCAMAVSAVELKVRGAEGWNTVDLAEALWRANRDCVRFTYRKRSDGMLRASHGGEDFIFAPALLSAAELERWLTAYDYNATTYPGWEATGFDALLRRLRRWAGVLASDDEPIWATDRQVESARRLARRHDRSTRSAGGRARSANRKVH